MTGLDDDLVTEVQTSANVSDEEMGAFLENVEVTFLLVADDYGFAEEIDSEDVWMVQEKVLEKALTVIESDDTDITWERIYEDQADPGSSQARGAVQFVLGALAAERGTLMNLGGAIIAENYGNSPG